MCVWDCHVGRCPPRNDGRYSTTTSFRAKCGNLLTHRICHTLSHVVTLPPPLWHCDICGKPSTTTSFCFMFHCFISLCFETMKHATWVFREFREFRDNLLPMHCTTLNSLNSLNTLTAPTTTTISIYTQFLVRSQCVLWLSLRGCGYTFIYQQSQG